MHWYISKKIWKAWFSFYWVLSTALFHLLWSEKWPNLNKQHIKTQGKIHNHCAIYIFSDASCVYDISSSVRYVHICNSIISFYIQWYIRGNKQAESLRIHTKKTKRSIQDLLFFLAYKLVQNKQKHYSNQYSGIHFITEKILQRHVIHIANS